MRHEFNLWQGYERDEFDKEWDDHIQWYHGARASEDVRGVWPRTLDLGIDVTQMLIEAYNLGDCYQEEARLAMENRGGSYEVVHEQSQPNHTDIFPNAGSDRGHASIKHVTEAVVDEGNVLPS